MEDKTKRKQEKRHERILHQFVKAIDNAFGNWKKIVFMNFVVGVMRGIGATFGTAIVLALVSLLLNYFGAFDAVSAWLGRIP